MKLLPFFDEKMSIEKLHIFEIDIYGSDTKKISRLKVEEEIFNYLNKYNNCLSSFYMAMTGFLFLEFEEYGKKSENALREIKEIYDNMELVNKNKESIIFSVLNNDQLENIHLERISRYRFNLEDIFIHHPSRRNNNDYVITILDKIKECFYDNNAEHLTDIAKETMEYENNKIINVNGLINIRGEWIKQGKYEQYQGNIVYIEPLFHISFIEYINKYIKWSKSERRFASFPKFYINLYSYDTKKGLPFVFNGEIELGKIFLLTEYNELNNNIKWYEIYITRDVIKIGRNGIWKIRKEYINETNEMLINKIQYGRNGIINL